MLEVQDIHKEYEGKPLLNGVSLRVGTGEILGLLGASGSGKSTLLRILAGLEQAERGRVLWEGNDLTDVPAHQRSFGLVFQDYALFPHLRVAANVAYGLRLRGWPRPASEMRVAELLEMVGLAGFGPRRIGELSGGEQQRVALARALATEPRLLMFDEPLGALDRTLRERLLGEIRRILRTSGVPAIYVTHDQEEAFALADRVALLHEGRILRQDTPDRLWARPGSVWAARFLDAGNLLEGRLHAGAVQTACGEFPVDCSHAHAQGARITVLVRREGVRMDPRGSLEGVVADVIFQKEHFQVRLENDLVFRLDERPPIGARIRLHVPADAVSCLCDEDDHGHQA